MIEHVEGLRAELETHTLRDREMLEQRHVEVRASGVRQEVPWHIAKR